jgi:hypothetical protein
VTTRRLSLSDRKKQRKELLEFQALASLIDLKIDPKSIKQLPPKAPDIECEVEGSGPLAVELTRLDSNATHQGLSNWQSTKDAWPRALEGRPAEEQAKIIREAGDLTLSLGLDYAANFRARVRIMRAIQDELLANPGHKGELFKARTMPEGLESGNAFRGSVSNGPHIVFFSDGYWRPPQITKIVEKLTRKTYVTKAPLELFAYSVHDEPTGAVGLQEQIEASVREHLPRSLFRRVHVFHLGFRQHIYSYPPL